MAGQQFHSLTIFSFVVIGIMSEDASLKGPYDICEREVFNASCSSGEMILMHSAMYGRMSLGTCIKQYFSKRKCDIDVLNIVDGMCSGLSSCTVRPVNPALLDVKPCPEHVAYLSSSYKCIKVSGEHSGYCRSEAKISHTSGFFSSALMTSSSGAGSSNCPWILNPEGNKRINITLYKFVPLNSPLSSSSSVCFEIGAITEGHSAQGILSCGSDLRMKSVYVSRGGPIELYFKEKSFLEDLGKFAIHFNVVGCEEPTVPKGAIYKRNGDITRISCEDSDASWEVTCQDGKWVGQVGTCFQEESKKTVLHWIKSNTSYSIGLLCFVTLGCAAFIFFCGFCVYVVHFYIMGKHRRQPPQQPIYDMENYKLQTIQRLKRPPSIAVYERTTSLPTPPGTMRRNTDYQRMNPIDPDTVSHHSYVLYDHVPKPLPPIPLQEEKKHIYETPLPVHRDDS